MRIDEHSNSDSSLPGIIGGTIAVAFTVVLIVGIVDYRIKKNKIEENKNMEGIDGSKSSQRKYTSTKYLPLSSILNGNVVIPSIKEFEELINYEDGIRQSFSTFHGEKYNTEDGYNLVSINLPFDHNRIKLRSLVNGSDYINANWISTPSEQPSFEEISYVQRNPFNKVNFAVGQHPLQNTLQHHYSMILETQMNVVVSIEENENKSPYIIGRSYKFKDLILRVNQRKNINDRLRRSEITLLNECQKEHQLVYFELFGWSKVELRSIDDFEHLVLSMCMIRNEMKQAKSALRVMVHDSRGGVGGAAFFVAMYRLMQQIDEAFNESDQLKQSIATDISIFHTVNGLRKDRAKMIEDYSIYKLLHRCLAYYGSKRLHLRNKVLHQSTKIDPSDNNSNFVGNVSVYSQDNFCSDIFSYTNRYQNISEMSEYF